jgi:hypothetical protein
MKGKPEYSPRAFGLRGILTFTLRASWLTMAARHGARGDASAHWRSGSANFGQRGGVARYRRHATEISAGTFKPEFGKTPRTPRGRAVEPNGYRCPTPSLFNSIFLSPHRVPWVCRANASYSLHYSTACHGPRGTRKFPKDSQLGESALHAAARRPAFSGADGRPSFVD